MPSEVRVKWTDKDTAERAWSFWSETQSRPGGQRAFLAGWKAAVDHYKAEEEPIRVELKRLQDVAQAALDRFDGDIAAHPQIGLAPGEADNAEIAALREQLLKLAMWW